MGMATEPATKAFPTTVHTAPMANAFLRGSQSEKNAWESPPTAVPKKNSPFVAPKILATSNIVLVWVTLCGYDGTHSCLWDQG
jgi:hypothetical protein